MSARTHCTWATALPAPSLVQSKGLARSRLPQAHSQMTMTTVQATADFKVRAMADSAVAG